MLEVAPAGANSSAIRAYASAATQPVRPAAELVPSAVAFVAVHVTSSQGKVTARRTLTGAAATRLVRDFDALTVSIAGVTNCPTSDDGQTSARMRADGHLWRATTSSCGDVSVTRDGRKLPALNDSNAFIRDLNRALSRPIG